MTSSPAWIFLQRSAGDYRDTERKQATINWSAFIDPCTPVWASYSTNCTSICYNKTKQSRPYGTWCAAMDLLCSESGFFIPFNPQARWETHFTGVCESQRKLTGCSLLWICGNGTASLLPLQSFLWSHGGRHRLIWCTFPDGEREGKGETEASAWKSPVSS